MKNNMIKYLACAAMALGLAANVQAAQFTGGISFTGDYTPNNNDLTVANSIAINDAFVGLGSGARAGTFNLVSAGATVTMYTPILVNPTVLPVSTLWSVAAGSDTFSMTLYGLSEDPPHITDLTLRGIGMLTDSAGTYDATMGTWTATFNSGGGTFTWSSSTGVEVPDGGMTVMLLGAALSGLALIRRKLA